MECTDPYPRMAAGIQLDLAIGISGYSDILVLAVFEIAGLVVLIAT